MIRTGVSEPVTVISAGVRGHSEIRHSDPVFAEERGFAYRILVSEVLTDDLVQEIRVYLNQQRALGQDAFQAKPDASRQFASP
jgi:hypothetical protein